MAVNITGVCASYAIVPLKLCVTCAPEKRDIWLINTLLSKWVSRQEWAKFNKSNIDSPTFNEFLSFLDTTCLALESTTTTLHSHRLVSR